MRRRLLVNGHAEQTRAMRAKKPTTLGATATTGVAVAFTCALAAAVLDLQDRSKFFRELDAHLHSASSILDFGGGRCELSAHINGRTNVTTVDIYRGCEDADTYDGRTLPYDDGSFDVVVASFVLHHIPHHRDIVQELHRVSRGSVVILEDNPRTHVHWALTRLHFLFFGQPMSTAEHVRPPTYWLRLLGGGSGQIDGAVVRELPTVSWLNPTPHVLIAVDST